MENIALVLDDCPIAPEPTNVSMIDLDPFGFLNISHAANNFTVVRVEAVFAQRTFTDAVSTILREVFSMTPTRDDLLLWWQHTSQYEGRGH